MVSFARALLGCCCTPYSRIAAPRPTPTPTPRHHPYGGHRLGSSSLAAHILVSTSTFGKSQAWWFNLKNSCVVQAGKESPPSSLDGRPPSVRFWTNFMLVANMLMFMAQTASEDRLLLWGAKVNSLIDQGQLWRLITPALLHANIFHLLVNCYSLNAVGPAVESTGGPRRFLAVYASSAVASCCLSYAMCESPAVGASGAIFGLAGALAVFVLRHRKMLSRGEESVSRISRGIALNLVLGFMVEGVDNWGHVGGLAGGAAIAWLIGPALRIVSKGQGVVLVDHPPIRDLLCRFSPPVHK